MVVKEWEDLMDQNIRLVNQWEELVEQTTRPDQTGFANKLADLVDWIGSCVVH